MTLRLTDEDTEALRSCAKAEGVSMQELAQRAIREYVMRRRERLTSAIEHVASHDAELLDRLSR
jgi:predicted transcriptional regulator